MTSLFRPWTEPNPIKSAATEMTTLYPEMEKATEWPPKEVETTCDDSDSSTRESRYKSVKEHMKKRSEKYLLKKLKVGNEKKVPVNTEETNNVKSLEISSVSSFPTSCCPPVEEFLNPFECYIPNKNVTMCTTPPLGFLPGSELLDAALSQGFPPHLFEEYARFLTEQQKQVSERSRKQRPKKFRCPHCHVGFSNNGQLKGHIRIHTGERPFKCDAESCGKSFTRNEELTRHRRIHSGLRPFPCSECGKRFGRKDHLKKHFKTHFQQRYQLVPILPSHCPYFYGL